MAFSLVTKTEDILISTDSEKEESLGHKPQVARKLRSSKPALRLRPGASEVVEVPHPEPKRITLKSGEQHIGPRLYQTGSKARERVREAQRQERESRLVKELERCTFKPELCQGTLAALKASSYRHPAARAEDQQQRKAALAVDAAVRSNALSQAYTFSPRVDPHSAKLVRRSASAQPRHRSFFVDEKLYIDSQERGLRQQLRSKEVMASQRKDTIGSGRSSLQDSTNTVKRLWKWQERKEKVLDTLRKECNCPHRSVVADVDVVVSRLHQSYAGNKTDMELSTQLETNLSFAPQISSISSMLASGQRNECFQKLFSSFDVHKIGTVTVDAITRQLDVSGEALRTLTDAFSGISPQTPIDCATFCTKLHRYEHRYGPQPWGRNLKLPQTDSFSFKPQLSDNSVKLLCGRRRALSVHEALYRQSTKGARDKEKSLFAPTLDEHSKQLSLKQLSNTQRAQAPQQMPRKPIEEETDDILQELYNAISSISGKH